MLTELMSKICDRVFSMTPVVNNESVNKNEITSIAVTSRNKIVGALLRGELEPNLGLTGTGQEVSIMRSTLVRTGIWSEASGIPTLNLRPADERMANLLASIENFILEARTDGRKSFGELYARLISPEYHIGLRLGLIPVYLAAVLHEYRQQTVITDRFGPVATSVDALVQINAEPDSYYLEYLDWNPEKESYIKRLSGVFSDYVVEAEKANNSYDYVANAMRRWYMALPKFSKESTAHPNGDKISKRQLNMIKLLRQNLSGSDLLFKKIPDVFKYEDEFSADAAEDVVTAKKVYDGLLTELKQYLIAETKAQFKQYERTGSGLISVMKEWSDSLDSKIFEQLFVDGTDKFLQLLLGAGNDEDQFITQLAKLATGLRLEDWDDKTIKSYAEAIAQYVRTANEFHSSVVSETINDTSSYQLTFADDEGQRTTKRFDRVEISNRGKLLFNQILSSLEAMGHSIPEQEKRQILMEVLKKLC